MKMTSFQIVLSGAFVFFILLGVGLFATQGGVNGGSGVGHVVIWGTVDQSEMDAALTALRQNDKTFGDVSYVEKSGSTYTADLINGMASGSGPDLFLLPQDQILAFADKVTPIPYATVSQAAFTSAFIDEGRMYLSSQGISAMPLLVDPLVMYWNRDMFSQAGFPQPPQYWSDLLTVAPRLTQIDGSANVTKSAVSLGTYNNVMYAKQILSAMFMQAGDRVIDFSTDGKLVPVLGSRVDNSSDIPAVSALQFYTEFADPAKTSYSWNRSLPQSQDAFVAGTSAVYFGLASEYLSIAARNPNLRFSVAELPQIKGGSATLTFGTITGVAISRAAANPSGAATVALALSAQPGISALMQATNLPSVRRDIVPDTSASAASAVFAQAALISSAWLDPNPQKTDDLFQTMIESVVNGKADPQAAVGETTQTLLTMMPK